MAKPLDLTIKEAIANGLEKRRIADRENQRKAEEQRQEQERWRKSMIDHAELWVTTSMPHLISEAVCGGLNRLGLGQDEEGYYRAYVLYCDACGGQNGIRVTYTLEQGHAELDFNHKTELAPGAWYVLHWKNE